MATPPPPAPPLRRALDWLRAHAYLLLAPLASLLLFLGIQSVPFFQTIENKTVDLRFQLRQSRDPKSDPRLLLIAIDEPSITSALGKWPWPRGIHGEFLQLLSQDTVKPSVIGWDILFTEKTNVEGATQAVAGGDQQLADGASTLDAVVTGALTERDKLETTAAGATPGDLTQPLPYVTGNRAKLKYSQKQADLPYPELRKNSFFGFVDSDPGDDGIRRLMPMVVGVGDGVYPSLDTQMLMRFWNLRPQDVRVNLGKSVEFLTLDGTVTVPINDQGEIRINYRNEHAFLKVSYVDALSRLLRLYKLHEPWPAKYPPLQGKILLVGQTATGLTDIGPSPLQGKSPLVLTHLNVLNNILQGDYLRQPSGAWFFLWIGLCWLLLAYPTLWLARHTPVAISVALPLGIAAVYLAVVYVLFARWSIVLPAAWPVLAFILIHFGSIVIRWLSEQRKNLELKAVFASYVSPNVMKKILDRPDSVHLTGENKNVTVFFSDIRSFSSFSEAMTEQELVRQLNEYFEPMVGAVFNFDGTLHKYIGDAVMAVWGDILPGDPGVAAQKAVRAALTMRRELTALNVKRVAAGLFKFHIGMGLNHGGVIVGDIGASQRREFTVIGDAVNLASRLEGVTKQYHTDLCIGESVRAFLGDEFLLRTIGLLVVKGKTKPVRVFEVIDEVGTAPTTDFDPAWVRSYEEGFNMYLDRKFEAAAARFEECLGKRPGDYCSEIYLEEARRLIQEPPGPEWTGVSKLDSK